MSPAVEELHYQKFHCIINMIDNREWNALQSIGITRSALPVILQAKTKSRRSIVALMQASSPISFDQDRFLAYCQKQEEDVQVINTIVGYMANQAPRDMLIQVMGITSRQWQQAKDECDLRGITYNTRRGPFKEPSSDVIDMIVKFGIDNLVTMNDYADVARSLKVSLDVTWAAAKHINKREP